MSVRKSETDDSSGIEICVFSCERGGSKRVRWVFMKMSENVIEREKELYAILPNMKGFEAKSVARIKA